MAVILMFFWSWKRNEEREEVRGAGRGGRRWGGGSAALATLRLPLRGPNLGFPQEGAGGHASGLRAQGQAHVEGQGHIEGCPAAGGEPEGMWGPQAYTPPSTPSLWEPLG